MRVIHVLRKPLSEGTVAANTVKHGTGGLNIDATRIGTNDSLGGGRLSGPTRMSQTCGGPEWNRPWMNDPALKEKYAQDMAEKVAKAESLGRWPANVILQHLDGCRCDGIKKVKSHNPGNKATRGGASTGECYGDYGKRSLVGHADEDGKESVANWICVEGCPVRALDGQSGTGESPKSSRLKTSGTDFGQINDDGWKPSGCTIYGYGDTGGPSRFFKQIGGAE